MSRYRTSGLLVPLGYAACLALSSVNTLARYVGGTGLLLYVALVVGATLLLWRQAPLLAARLSQTQARGLMLCLFAGLTVLFLIGYPRANSGALGAGSDRDEAIELATSKLLAGEYPYYQKTYLGNPISPMPGALFLSVPFVLLGNGAYQILFWLALFLLVAGAFLLDSRYLLLMLASLLALAPKVAQELVTGSDFVANALYIQVSFVLLVEAVARPRRGPRLGAALFLGVALSSRANFLLLLPLLYALLGRRGGWRAATTLLSLAVATFALVTLPFWLYDPAAFSPLTTAAKLAQLDALLPYSSLWIVLLTGGVSAGLAARQRGAGYARFFASCAVVQTVPVLAAILVPSLAYGRFIWSYGTRYAIASLFFGATAFWLYLVEREESAAGAA